MILRGSILLGLSLIVCNFSIFAQAPGGATSNLELWLKADAGVTGGNVSSWADQSGNGNNATQASGANRPALVNPQVNYNPAIDFDANEFLGGSSGGYSNSYYLVTVPDADVDLGAAGQIVFGMNTSTSASDFGGLAFGNITGTFTNEVILHLDGASGDWRSGSTGSAFFEAGTPIVIAVREDAPSPSYHEVFANGLSIYNNQSGTFRSISNEAFNIGRANPGSPFGTFEYDGKIAEVITYSSRTSDTDHGRIQSYLALKYGVMLDQSSAQNYVNSSGTTIWDVTLNAGFNNDIAGIGRDDNSGLNQKQSKSVYSSAILNVGLGTIAGSNSANSNSFTTNNAFLVLGHNNGSTGISTTYGGGTFFGVGRIWAAEETGTVGSVRLQVAKSDIAGSVTHLYVKNGDASLGNGGTTYALVDGGTDWYIDVDLADGDFFTFGTTTSPDSPGGVFADLSLWLKADAGVSTTAGRVNTWTDQSGDGNDASQGTVSLRPDWADGQINYNPSVYFNATEIDGNAGFYTQEYFIVTKPDITPIDYSENGFLVGYEINEFGGLFFGTQPDGYVADDIIVHAIGDNGDGDAYREAFLTGSVKGPALVVNSRNNAGSTLQEIAANAKLLNTNSYGVLFSNLSDQAYRIGDNFLNSNAYSGHICEVISYRSRLSDSDRNNVYSYLSLKYGFPLDTSVVSDLVSSSGAIIWNGATNAGFSSGKAGIGRDDVSGLDQRQSASTASSSVLQVGLGTVAASNSANANTFATDGSFMVWGHNNKAVSLNTSYNGGLVYGLGRIWKIAETNSVGTVRVQVNKSDVPGGLTSVYVKNGDQTLGSGGTSYTLNDGGSTWYADIDFNDGDYFTFTGPMTTPVAPGNVLDGLATWLKADVGVVESGGNISAWNDQVGPHHALQPTGGIQPIYETGQINGNPAVSFSGTEYLDATSGFYTTEYFLVALPNEVYNNANTVGTIISFERSNFSKLGLGPATSFANNELVTHAMGGYSGNYRSVYISTTDNLTKSALINSRNNASADGQDIFYNGALISNGEVDAAAFYNLYDNGFRIGDNTGRWEGSNYNGHIAEIITYDRRLSDGERRDVATYLAIKYGITLDISTQPYTVNGSAIYSSSSYGNDVAGIGVNTSQGLSQSGSKSVNAGSIVKIFNASDLNDGEYLIWGNDGGPQTFTTANVPVGAAERMEKIWGLEETGDVGTVSISFDITSLGINMNNSAINLFIAPAGSTIPDDFASVEIVTGGVLSVEDGRNLITFSNVDLSDGDFFTIGGDIQTQAPGGVDANLALWLRADEGVVSTANAVSDWLDRSGNANDAYQGTSGLKPAVVDDEINFNPAIDFAGDNLDGISGFYTAEYFIVTKPDVAIDGTANGFLVGFEQAEFGGYYFGNQADGYVPGDVIVHGIGDNGDGDEYREGYTGAAITSPVVIASSRNNAANTAQELGINGAVLSTTSYGPGYLNLSDQAYRIGDNLLGSNAYDGYIAEVISYNTRLSDADRRDVETYLALKYGVTMDISVLPYTEGGIAIYDNTSYANDIAGIGKNLDNALDQQVSISQNLNSIIRMEGPSMDNGDYLIWGNDGTNKASVQATEVPALYSERLSTEWQVDVTGSPGTVTVRVYVGGIANYVDREKLATLYTLLINTTNDFSTTASSYDGSSLSGDTVTFQNVSFADGDFFTVVVPGLPANPPGTTLWLRSDDGVTLNGPNVSQWDDQSGSLIAGMIQSSASSQPAYTTNALNGHSVIEFDGSNDRLEVTANSTNLMSSNQGALFVVMRADGQGNYFDWNEGADDNRIALVSSGNNLQYIFPRDANTVTGSTTVVGGSYIIASAVSNFAASTTNQLFVNGTSEGTAATSNTLTNSSDEIYLGDGDGVANTNMNVAEIIAFNVGMSATERRDIESYLAIKYGIALDISGQDYTFNGGTSIYGYTTHANDIAGLGAYNDLGLAQDTSGCINTSAIVSMHNPTSLNSGEFLLWGHDGGAVSTTTTSGVPTGLSNKMTRVWRMQETGDVGTVSITFDLNGLGYSSTPLEDIRLIVSDASFNTMSLEVPVLFNSDLLTFENVELNGASYFELGFGVDFSTDTDDDGIPDYFETAFLTDYADGNSPVTGGGPGQVDTEGGVTGPDSDGVSDALERILLDNGATGPVTRMTDTDGDGISDYLEVQDGTDPFSPNQPTYYGDSDSDGDGVPDALEIYITSKGGASDPDLSTDTDSDGVPDFYEVLNKTNPNDGNDPAVSGGTDSDGDGISNALESIFAGIGVSGPVDGSTDTDVDGLPDYMEALTFSDLQNQASPAAPTGYAIRSLTSDYATSSSLCTDINGYQWIHITDQLGNLVFSINAVGNDLGSTCWGIRVINGASNVRVNGNEYVMNRNWYITPSVQPTTKVFVRFFALNREPSDLYDKVVTDGHVPGTFPLADFTNDSINFTKISGQEILNPFTTEGTRELLVPFVSDFASSGKVFTLGVGSFSEFAGHYIVNEPASTLPIELLSFEAVAKDHRVHLNWTTASETGNDYFVIERSVDGKHFTEIEQVEGAGYSEDMRYYATIDNNPVAGESYYRLKQVDFDHQYSYSALVRVEYGPDLDRSVLMYPNPTEGEVSVYIGEGWKQEDLVVSVVDLNGKEVLPGTHPTSSIVHLNLSQMERGLYIVKISLGETVIGKSLILK